MVVVSRQWSLQSLCQHIAAASSSALQEGWRIEHADPNDTSTPLQFKGVLFVASLSFIMFYSVLIAWKLLDRIGANMLEGMH